MRNLLVLSFALCCLFMTAEVSAQWILGPVDTLTSNEVMDQNGPEALAMDSSGTLHVVWRQEVTDSSWRILYMSKESEGDWSSPVEIPSVFANNGIPAMEVGYSTGVAHVVWHGLDTLDGDREIFYGTNESGSWETIALTSDTTDDYDPTITLDGLGNVHMAWVGFDTLLLEIKMEYATNMSGGMAVQVLEESQPGEYPYWLYHGPPSIATSSEGVAHISYIGSLLSGRGWRIHHIENDTPAGTDWSNEEMETDAQVYDEYSSIAVDRDGDLHLAISGQLGGPGECCYRTLYFHRSSGSAEWDSAQLATSCVLVFACHFLEEVALAVDMSGTLHLVTPTGTHGGLYSYCLLYSTNGHLDAWNTQVMLYGGPTSTWYHTPSLVVDHADYGHLVFWTSGTFYPDPLEIMYTRSAEPLWPKDEFIRGDVDQSEHWGIMDAVFILKYLYVPDSPAPTCIDAADVDDNGTVDMADAFYTLKYLYRPGSPAPRPPFPNCGTDPTWDELGCGSYSLCE